MADIESFQEGDKVGWSWGNGQPNGTVAEIKTSGKLEIESAGKLVHKNADPSNPAVHVERSGNDVVKRASELHKIDSATTEEDAGEPSATVEEPSGEESTAKSTPKKRGRKKTNAAATVGDKREREAGGETEATGAAEGATEQEAAEMETGKKTKKTKAAKAETGEKKSPGRPRKATKSKKEQAEGEAMQQVDANAEQAGEGETTPKKRGRGRPRKSTAADQPPAQNVPVTEDVPAARTRSKHE